jgi:two-component sensor histidine kinase
MKRTITQNQDLTIKNSHVVYSIIIFLILIISLATILIILNKKLIKLKKDVINKDIIISNEKKTSENFQTSIHKTLQERELQLKEIHHRVKNNLQTILSLLRVEAKEGTKANDINYFVEKSQTRILSISLLHQNLYENKNLKNIDYKVYLNEMCKNLDSILNVSNKKIRFTISADFIFFNIETAGTLGLIINELITNSYKHAFKNEIEGKIKITVVKNFEKEYTVTYSDNGIGIPADNTNIKKSLGIELIELWTQQLNGKLIRKNTIKGLAYQIVINENTSC